MTLQHIDEKAKLTTYLISAAKLDITLGKPDDVQLTEAGIVLDRSTFFQSAEEARGWVAMDHQMRMVAEMGASWKRLPRSSFRNPPLESEPAD